MRLVGQRKNDHAGLGDWYVNPQKFPHGLKPLIDRVHSLGMDFGLWVEPEMVNPDSDLYRKRPDWVMNFPGRPRTKGRDQLVLNLLAMMSGNTSSPGWIGWSPTMTLLSKWDYNRNWSEPGWPEALLADQRKSGFDMSRIYARSLTGLEAGRPRLEIEGCSGGGARVDLGMFTARRSGLAFRQHRRSGSVDHPIRIYSGIHSACDDGMGH